MRQTCCHIVLGKMDSRDRILPRFARGRIRALEPIFALEPCDNPYIFLYIFHNRGIVLVFDFSYYKPDTCSIFDLVFTCRVDIGLCS